MINEGLPSVLAMILQKTESIGHRDENNERFVLRNWIIRLWRLPNSISIGQASRMNIQVRVYVAVLSPKTEHFLEFLLI